MVQQQKSHPQSAAPSDWSGQQQQQPPLSAAQKKRMMKSVECTLENGNHVVVGSLDDEDDETELTWRLDAKKSLSDWTVVVTTKETGAVQVYNVHKNFLAVGPRKSLYFAREFAAHNKKLQEQHEREQQKQQQKKPPPNSPEKKSLLRPFHSGIEPCEMITRKLRHERDAGADSVARLGNQMVTKLELPQLAAEALPQVLDYIYSGGTRLEVNTHNATPLHYLGDLFEIKPLRRFVRGFWQQDLCVENLCLYYRHATTVGDIPVLRHAQEFCARNIFEIPEDYVVQVLTAIDADFFFHVISHHAAIGTGGQKDDEGQESDDDGEEKSSKALPAKDVRAISSKRLSLIVAVYCNIHRQDLTGPLFLRLVGPDILPEIDLKAAKVLLELEYYICRDKDKLTSLKKRCIKVMSKKWDHVCVDSRDFDVVSLPRLGGEALERFLALSFTNAKERLSTLDQIFSEWDKVQAELQRLRTEVRKLRDEKKNFYGEAIFETYSDSLPTPTNSSHLPMKGRAFQDMKNAASGASVQTKSSAGDHVMLSPNAFERGTAYSSADDAQSSFRYQMPNLMTPSQVGAALTHVNGSSVMSEQPSAASLSAYADFVMESMPTRVEAIELARNRQKVALSAYEEAVAKLKQTSDARAVVEGRAGPEWSASHSVSESYSTVNRPVQGRQDMVAASPMSQSSPRREVLQQPAHVYHSAGLPQGQVPSQHLSSRAQPVDPLLASPIASEFTAYEGSVKSPTPSQRTTTTSYFQEERLTSGAPTSPTFSHMTTASEQRIANRQHESRIQSPRRGSFTHTNATQTHEYTDLDPIPETPKAPNPMIDSRSQSNRTARTRNSIGAGEPRNSLSRTDNHALRPISTGRMSIDSDRDAGRQSGATPARTQDILKDAASTAKSLFSFTKNYIKTSASHFANAHPNDDSHSESTENYQNGNGQGRALLDPKHPSSDDFATSPVSVAVFDEAPSFDVGSLVQEACKSHTPGAAADAHRAQLSNKVSATVSTATASSIASTQSW